MSVTLISGSSCGARVDLVSGLLSWYGYLGKRPVYYSGLFEPDFDFLLPPVGHTMADWYEWAPVSSILIVENSQAFFNPLVRSLSYPQCVSALETHRHHLIDFFFLVPHHFDLHPYVRAFSSPHYHVTDTLFGHSLIKWPTCHYEYNPYTRLARARGVHLSYKSCCRVTRSGDK